MHVCGSLTADNCFLIPLTAAFLNFSAATSRSACDLAAVPLLLPAAGTAPASWSSRERAYEARSTRDLRTTASLPDTGYDLGFARMELTSATVAVWVVLPRDFFAGAGAGTDTSSSFCRFIAMKAWRM